MQLLVQGCRKWGLGGRMPSTHILADQLTLSQPEGADYAPPPPHHITTRRPRFSDLPTFLLTKLRRCQKVTQTKFYVVSCLSA
jgi:hypothetical protein